MDSMRGLSRKIVCCRTLVYLLVVMCVYIVYFVLHISQGEVVVLWSISFGGYFKYHVVVLNHTCSHLSMQCMISVWGELLVQTRDSYRIFGA